MAQRKRAGRSGGRAEGGEGMGDEQLEGVDEEGQGEATGRLVAVENAEEDHAEPARHGRIYISKAWSKLRQP